MNHFIKIFLSFILVNYLFFYTYDNYYLVSVEDSYISESRDQLRQYALSLRSELSVAKNSKSNKYKLNDAKLIETKLSENNLPDPNQTDTSLNETSLNITYPNGTYHNVVNHWAKQQNIPTQIIAIKNLEDNIEIFTQLVDFDYAIDIFSEYGPVVIVKMNEEKAVVVGPLDPLSIESTTLQPLFILLHIVVNGATCLFLFLLFKRKTKRVEDTLDNVINRKTVSHKNIGEQDVLQKICNRVLAIDNYINEIEDQNCQATTDQRDLMHAVAHELRSPIARFSFALELIEDSIKSEEQVKMIAEMHDSIDELESLIKEILSYSRLSYGSTKLCIESIDITALIETCSSRLKILYPQKEIQLEKLNEAVIANADRRFLERALVNLLRNAARFASKQVKVTFELTEHELKIIIDDDGIGIPPGKRERIFEAFTRLDPSRSRDSGGVGLGLAIVKKIAEKHKGNVHVSDSPLGGARFSFCFPIEAMTLGS